MKFSGGMKIGRYVLDSLIGDGGEAQVWRAHWSEEKMFVCALKLRPAAKLVERDDVERQNDRFVNENHYWLQFTQSAIFVVSILDIVSEIIEDDDGTCWVVRGVASELSEIGDLHEAIVSGRIIDDLKNEMQLIEFLQRIISSVNAGHRRNITHGDIKPRNILLFKDDNTIVPKLTDFGVARGSLEPLQGFTRGYAAPEIKPGSAPGPQSDVYSLGITFYEIFYAAILVDDPPKTASEFDDGSAYKNYLRTTFDLGTMSADFDATPYLNLMASMTAEAPDERAKLDQVNTVLSKLLRDVLRRVPVYTPLLEQSRYHWHPGVHTLLEETLYYFLVKGGNAALEIKDLLTDLDQTDIEGFSVRTVSGWWDYIVRIWVPTGASNVARVREKIERNGRRATPLEVIASELHRKPLDHFSHHKNKLEMLREIERHTGENALKSLTRSGLVISELNRSDRYFRVTVLVSISPESQELGPVIGGMIKKTIKTCDRRAKDVSFYSVKPIESGINIRLVVKFMHSNFQQCRVTLMEVFQSLTGYQIDLKFYTLFDLNGDNDRLSDDGSIAKQVVTAHLSNR